MWEPAIWILLTDWCLRIIFSVLVILRTRTVGTALAWLLIILLFPIIGTGIYLLLGDNRLSRRRAQVATQLRSEYVNWRERQLPYLHDAWVDQKSDLAQLSRMIAAATDSLPLAGNRMQLLRNAEEVFGTMINDIDRAQASCYLEYYIWEAGGLADKLAERLAEAARRGVDCKILVDAVGAGGFLRSRQARDLRQAGVQIQSALPVSLLRAILYRFDLRLHRKIVVIDGRIGYTGSQNMADPKFFRRGAGFGQWVDAMVRLEGPAVDALLMVFTEDWYFETSSLPFEEKIGRSPQPTAKVGNVVTQVIPSGPGLDSEAIVQILIGAIYAADQQLIITTPYLVPDESLQRALISAARRGADVKVVIPSRVDSHLVRLASRQSIRELTAAGVKIYQYRAGMLHTKSITIDGEISFFGSLNLDPRSIQLNFELTLVSYDEVAISDLISLQNEYIEQSDLLVLETESKLSFPTRFLESCARLLSPLL